VAIESSKAECKQEAGLFAPVIDRMRCEAKEDCVEACPYDVFEVRKLSDDDKRALPLIARVKAWVHGDRQAFAVRAGEWHACGLCVIACPEHAIKLMRVTTA
jgi:NAD-dependent dihydropyrimidine dehydrogenase PreA subunit